MKAIIVLAVIFLLTSSSLSYANQRIDQLEKEVSHIYSLIREMANSFHKKIAKKDTLSSVTKESRTASIIAMICLAAIMLAGWLSGILTRIIQAPIITQVGISFGVLGLIVGLHKFLTILLV